MALDLGAAGGLVLPLLRLDWQPCGARQRPQETLRASQLPESGSHSLPNAGALHLGMR